MKPGPHAVFHRDRYGRTVTIEVNSRRYSGTGESRTNGIVTARHVFREGLAITQSMYPFWSYETGFSENPIWIDPTGTRCAWAEEEMPSYIGLLRKAVAVLTSGGLGFIPGGKPKLGFHSSYRAAVRARLKS